MFDDGKTRWSILKTDLGEVAPLEELAEVFTSSIHDVGLDRAREVFGHQLKRPFSPLHSSLYDQLSRNIAVLIVDESHDSKNEESVLNAAIRSLRYHYSFLLTGTPVYNTWEDLLGQTKLLACGGLFTDKEHYRKLFGAKGPPQGASVIVVPVHLEKDRASVMRISDFVSCGLSYLKRKADEETRKGFFKKAMAVLSKAEKLAACPILLKATQPGEEDQGETDGPPFEVRLQKALEKFVHEKKLQQGLSLDELDDERFSEFRFFWDQHSRRRRGTSTREDPDQSHNGNNNTESQEEGSSDAAIGINDENLVAVGRVVSQDDNVVYNEDQDDASSRPGDPEPDSNSGEIVDEETVDPPLATDSYFIRYDQVSCIVDELRGGEAIDVAREGLSTENASMIIS
ncbi:hypothetical protein NM208_g13760 [Fusarium decemcellulare]|uniref:Uncharacterized protein n=1 Tax=Fusarium decemcellulare TaxID=57161 RepID=A0ACC1RIM6_9HYPO|nr:hypothetical protein NM208_g13760 [Fusarium decemcellulare]